MSTAVIERSGREDTVLVRNWKAPIGFAIGALAALLVFALGAPDSTAVFRVSAEGDAVVLPDLQLPAAATGWVSAVLLAGLAAYSFRLARGGRPMPRWLLVAYGVLFIAAFLTWVVGSARTPNIYLSGLVAGSVTLAVPLIFGSLSGVLCERVGIVNIAIEGQLLFGAFAAAIGASLTGNVYVGLVSAAIAGVLVSLVLAVFSIKYLVNQIIVGVVLNVLVSGLTGFLYSTVLAGDAVRWNTPGRLPQLAVPLLADIPLLGPVLFRQTIIGYLMYAAVILVWIGLFKTKWGLRLRAVGEHPQAADTVGINVNRTRFRNVLLAGAVAGLGGSFYTLVSVTSFTKDMTSGAGFIALAALIFGRWNPIGAFFASLLFGFATNLQYVLAQAGTGVPSQFMQMLPYVITILAVAGLVGRSRPPAAEGIPYVKE